MGEEEKRTVPFGAYLQRIETYQRAPARFRALPQFGVYKKLKRPQDLGVGFIANFIGALVATVGIYRDALWGWFLGACIPAVVR